MIALFNAWAHMFAIGCAIGHQKARMDAEARASEANASDLEKWAELERSKTTRALFGPTEGSAWPESP